MKHSGAAQNSHANALVEVFTDYPRSLSPLSSGVMKPKPFFSLNHLTVPVAIDRTWVPDLAAIRRAEVTRRAVAILNKEQKKLQKIRFPL